MREALYNARHDGQRWPSHVGLAYDMWAGSAAATADCDLDDTAVNAWLDGLTDVPMHDDYRIAYLRWKRAMAARGARVVELVTTAPLLCGVGNPSGSNVGLTVHHTWGVPMIPGSSLKGLLHHWCALQYGPADLKPTLEADDAWRNAFAPALRGADGKGFVQEPGPAIRELFGAPNMEGDAGAKGSVVFYDALLVVDNETDAKPFAKDIINVHQRKYYGQGTAQDAERTWPNDYDEPNIVKFLVVKKGTRFLLALEGEESLTHFAYREACAALETWGVGAKTRAGYGTLEPTGRLDGALRLGAAGDVELTTSAELEQRVVGEERRLAAERRAEQLRALAPEERQRTLFDSRTQRASFFLCEEYSQCSETDISAGAVAPGVDHCAFVEQVCERFLAGWREGQVVPVRATPEERETHPLGRENVDAKRLKTVAEWLNSQTAAVAAPERGGQANEAPLGELTELQRRIAEIRDAGRDSQKTLLWKLCHELSSMNPSESDLTDIRSATAFLSKKQDIAKLEQAIKCARSGGGEAGT